MLGHITVSFVCTTPGAFQLHLRLVVKAYPLRTIDDNLLTTRNLHGSKSRLRTTTPASSNASLAISKCVATFSGVHQSFLASSRGRRTAEVNCIIFSHPRYHLLDCWPLIKLAAYFVHTISPPNHLMTSSGKTEHFLSRSPRMINAIFFSMWECN